MRAWLGGIIVAAFAATLLAQPEVPQASRAGGNRLPAIELDTAACARTGTRPKICAFVLDDKGVLRVTAVFRAGGSRPYYWTPMTFDGTRYCGWLPQPLSGTTAVEYYIEAFDDEYEISRSRSETLQIGTDCRTFEGQPPASSSAVGAAAPGQPATPPGFDPGTVRPPS